MDDILETKLDKKFHLVIQKGILNSDGPNMIRKSMQQLTPFQSQWVGWGILDFNYKNSFKWKFNSILIFISFNFLYGQPVNGQQVNGQRSTVYPLHLHARSATGVNKIIPHFDEKVQKQLGPKQY